jgi:hypothetical protein
MFIYFFYLPYKHISKIKKMNTYSDFVTPTKSSFYLKPMSGSMIALSHKLVDDVTVSPPALIPVEDTLNQYSTLPRVTHEDVNTIHRPPKVPFLTNVYIGSLTIVGLFVLFRFIQKHP